MLDCVNCGAPLRDKHDLCEYCGTLNDADRRRLGGRPAAVPHVPAAQGQGDGEVAREARLERDRRRQEVAEAVAESIRVNMVHDFRSRVRTYLIVALLLFGVYYLGDRLVRREVIARAHCTSALSSLHSGSYALALQCCRDAIRIDSRFPEPCYIAGMVTFQQYVREEGQGRRDSRMMAQLLDNALGWLQKAAAMKEPYPQVHYHLSMCYFKMGQRERAVREIERCLEQLPRTGRLGTAEVSKWRTSAQALRRAYETCEPLDLRLFATCSYRPNGARFSHEVQFIVSD